MTHRRRKLKEKAARRSGDELPWELPAPLERTKWPAPLCRSLSSFFAPGSVSDGGRKPKPVSTSTPNARFTPLSGMCMTMSHNDGESKPWLPGSGGLVSTNFPTIAFTDIKCDSRESEKHSSNGKTLPPIGVFWDIENCSVPSGRSALVAVQRIRDKFFLGHVEAEFLCVCDIRKESPSVIQELNDAQVSVNHVSANSKNAADDKLRQAMRRFADISCSNPINSEWVHPATVILISGDINFVADLSDLRYRKRLYVILLHNRQTPDALLLCAHEQYEFHSILTDLPFRVGYKDFAENSSQAIPLKGGLSMTDVVLGEIPLSSNLRTQNFIRNRLRKLSENCGGRVVNIYGNRAVIRFPNYEAALRASKRMNGEDVLGNKIRVVRRQQVECVEYQQASNIQEDLSHDSIANMSGIKPNLGMLSNPSVWKPTWTKRSLPSNSFRLGSSRHHHGGDEYKYQAGQSNSSSVETSRDDSPTFLVQNPVPGPSHLNSASQCHSSSIGNNIYPPNNTTAAHQYTFQHGLYPNMDPQSLFRQDYQHHQNSTYQPHGDVGGAGPRLYSTMGAYGNNGSPSQSHGQPPISSQPEPDFNRPPPMVGNGIYAYKTTPPPGKSAEQYFRETGQNTNGGTTDSYSKARSKDDGDSFDLNVTNIDPNIGDWRTIRGVLTTAFGEHVKVRGIWVSPPSNGSVSATVKLNSKDDAHCAVAQLHGRKFGNKKIFVSFDEGNPMDYGKLKKEVASLLLDVPNHSLPFFKFREMFQKRYKRSILSVDLYRIKDVVNIADTSPNASGTSTPTSGRTVTLAPQWRSKEGRGLELYCKLHAPKTQKSSEKSRTGWAEKEAEVLLPNAVIEIKLLGTRVHALLQSHHGGFPLLSFLDCYEAEFGPLEVAAEGNGVPLEHLITCVQGVQIALGENGMKRVQWHEKKDDENHSLHQSMDKQLALFGRELIDLLKTFPKCTLPFSRLIPSYHAHFGRQCRVADYGHCGLLALLESLPHIIQIMGAAQNRIITLSHWAQMKRFATDMLRVLKSQGGPKKQIRLDEFPTAFVNTFSQREFQPEDYGLCFFSDLLSELLAYSSKVALVKDEEGELWLAVPKREQTPNEMFRTELFSTEVVELLRHSTRCELEFSKFVPYYHHHFEKQCRVSEYGFSKLAELFDAISDTVILISPTGRDSVPEDKIIRLTPKEQIKVVGEQICSIVVKRKESGLATKMEDIVEYFLDEHGFFLRPELCGASSLEDLIENKLDIFVKVIDDEIVAVDRVQIEDLAQKAEAILQEAEEYSMDIKELVSILNEKCGGGVNEVIIEKDLRHIAIVGEDEDGNDGRTVNLTPLRVFAYEMKLLLESKNGSVPFSNLENLYLEKFGQPLRPAQLGHPTALSILQAISDVVSIHGKQRAKKMVVLNSAKLPMESTSDDSCSTYGRQTPRNGQRGRWKGKENRYPNSGGTFRRGKFNETTPRRTRPVLPPPPLFSPVTSPGFQPSHDVFTFERPVPLSPQMYDMWVQESVAPGSPPVSPPVVWTCHPIFYPQSPNPSGPANILVPSPFGGPAPWSPPAMNSTCFETIQPTQPPTMLGNEYLFGQGQRLAASFEKLGVDSNGSN